jgi:large subunit ribosomal protein L20
MSRVKRGTISMKRRRNVLKDAKGFRFGRSKKEREAKVALTKAGVHAFTHRRQKKANFRGLWQTRLSAALAQYPIGTGVKPFSYSKFIGALKKKGVLLNRKMLADLAATEPKVFEAIVTLAKS